MRLAPALLLLLCATTGCARTYAIRTLDSEAARRFDQAAAKRDCDIVLVDGSTRSARRVSLDEQTTAWLAPDTGQEVQVPTARVHKVVFGDRGKTAAKGVFGGLAVGLIAGVIAGATRDECRGDYFCPTSFAGGVTGGMILVGLPLAALFGGAGAATASTEVFYPFPERRAPLSHGREVEHPH